MASQILTPKQKAFDINIDPKIYGTFAEIGAGQEVARHFFRAGGAAGTIAKTISAYDMVVSDSIYGKEKSGRYVCESRVKKMLQREFGQLITRLGPTRGEETCFFAFANTVAAQSFRGSGECHGWMGLHFQQHPGALVSEVVIHVRMLDPENFQQQEAIGIMGTNLVYSAFRKRENPEEFVTGLMDGLSTRRIEIDMIRVYGDGFKNIDSRVLSLELVKSGFCNAVLFDEDGNVARAADVIYKKNLVVLRGSFRPPTHVNMDMLETGLNKFKTELSPEERRLIEVLPEISMSKLLMRGADIHTEDFLARVDLCSAIGQKVLITNYDSYFHLNEYLSHYGRKKIAFVTGVYNLEEILDIDRYVGERDGILGALGQLFGHQSRLYIYPAVRDSAQGVEGELKTLEDVKIDSSLTFLYLYLCENKLIQEIEGFNPAYSSIWSRTVVEMIKNDEPGWEKMVPEVVARTVKKKRLFKD